MIAVASMQGMAQDSYLNNQLIQSSDLFGTARYVGMGGAMGALGADISAMSSSPAAIGMIRRSTGSLTFGVQTQTDKNTDGEKATKASFDQVGFVISFGGDNSSFNFGVNYQKKSNLTHTFVAEQDFPNGSITSLMDNVSMQSNPMGINWYDGDRRIFYGMAEESGLLRYNAADKDYYAFDDPETSHFRTDFQRLKRVTTGNTHCFDINMSGNINNRVFWGVTFGVNRLDYVSDAMYDEGVTWIGASGLGRGNQNYSFENRQTIKGNGLNVKAGIIVRPVEDSPFRFGLAIETPTWYKLNYSGTCAYWTPYIWDNTKDNWAVAPGHDYSDMQRYYTASGLQTLKYNLTTPWKFRLSMGHTFGTKLALGAEYEYSGYQYTSMGYPDERVVDYYDRWGYLIGSGFSSHETKDKAMNRQTKNLFKGQHSLKLGAELKIIPQFAIRAGYNYYSSPYRKTSIVSNIMSDENMSIDSYATMFLTNADYLVLGDVNILTFGLGFSGKNFFADFAYKYRMQKADSYAYAEPYVNAVEAPVSLDMNHHQAFLTLGFKF